VGAVFEGLTSTAIAVENVLRIQSLRLLRPRQCWLPLRVVILRNLPDWTDAATFQTSNFTEGAALL
jgi:hypothetical protein